MSSEGRNFTNSLKVEARQHEILGFDLGEGPLRSNIAIGFFTFLIWLAFAIPVVVAMRYFASTDTVFLGIATLIAPPLLFISMGMSPSEDIPQRARLVALVLRIMFVLKRHISLIGLGARPAEKSESVPWRERVRHLTGDRTLADYPEAGCEPRAIPFDWNARLIAAPTARKRENRT